MRQRPSYTNLAPFQSKEGADVGVPDPRIAFHYRWCPLHNASYHECACGYGYLLWYMPAIL